MVVIVTPEMRKYFFELKRQDPYLAGPQRAFLEKVREFRLYQRNINLALGQIGLDETFRKDLEARAQAYSRELEALFDDAVRSGVYV